MTQQHLLQECHFYSRTTPLWQQVNNDNEIHGLFNKQLRSDTNLKNA